mgnify:CR=1 FL=1
MAVNRFVLNGISYHGHGAINEIPGIVKSKGFKKAFVASDPDLVKFGVTAKVTDLLKENGIEYELYSDIKPNPTIENVLHGVDAYKASEADFTFDFNCYIFCTKVMYFVDRLHKNNTLFLSVTTLIANFAI